MNIIDNFREENLEKAFIEILKEMNYDYIFGPDLSPGGDYPERITYQEVLLKERILENLLRINNGFSRENIEEAYKKIISFNTADYTENNKYFHSLLTEGIPISLKEDNIFRTKNVKIIDFGNPLDNDFLVVNQFTVFGKEERRPDIVIFINGIPIIVMELKSATDENVGIEDAFNQIETYKNDIPNLFYYNGFCVISDGLNAKVGTISSNFERFMNWRTIDGEKIEPLDMPQYEVMLRGLFSKEKIIDILENYILFQESKTEDFDDNGNKLGERKTIIKILAAYHQYYAVKKAVEKTETVVEKENDNKIGVVWHTQGSGKSLSMVFYAAKLIKKLNNPTIVVITDRNDLDDQLFNTFSSSKDILRQTPVQAEVRKLRTDEDGNTIGSDKKGLFDLLNDRESGGIIFTTIQKFKPEGEEMPVLSDRKNIIIIADEAHRSQYGFEPITDKKTGKRKYGYAKYLRDALPNASFIGFTGTPIEKEDKSTPAVFGDYIDIYDMTRAVEDKATVKIYYESRIIKLDTSDEILGNIDDEFEEITEGQEELEKENNKSIWSKLEKVVGSPNRLKKLAEDIVSHYETKNATIDGKAMIVCMSRKICVDLYNEITKIRPEWHNDNNKKGKIKVIMTGSASDNPEMQKHIGGKERRKLLENRIKDPSDELKIVIVRDMWLTGFDVPSMHTMYIDKPMKGHNLMQAIARVNRVFKDKDAGAVVDYIGILESLKSALNDYTDTDRQNTGINNQKAIDLMMEYLSSLRYIFQNVDYSDFYSMKQSKRMRAITSGWNYVLGLHEEEQKEFKKLATSIAKVHSIVAATEEGKKFALEISYFKAVKASLTKLTEEKGIPLTKRELEQRMTQILQKSIISSEVIDVFDALGLERPKVSILSEEFLNEIKNTPNKNIAAELLKKLLEGNIKLLERKNLVKSELFSEKLKKAINKYRNQAITNAEVIHELLQLAKEITELNDNDKLLGLNEDEAAFYYALTSEKIVKEFMEDETLKKIAQELTKAIRNNITIDWNIRENSRAKMRSIIRRLLKKYDYPPKEAKKALETVIKQAELICFNINTEDSEIPIVADETKE